MSENIAKIILDILKDYDYKNVSQQQLRKIMGNNEAKYYGCMTVDVPKPTIYILKNQPYNVKTDTQLHEIAHAYMYTITKNTGKESEIDKLAKEWKRIIDGVYKK